MRFFAAILGIIAGFVVVRYAHPIKQAVGSMEWAEKIFGMGGTTTALQVVGLLISICSFLSLTGTFDATLSLIFGGLVGMGG
jgi:hypothetical protein